MWPLLEHFRADVSRHHEGFRIAILDFKADWPAVVEVAGLRTWSHSLHCCPCCMAPKSQLNNLSGFSLKTSPFPVFDDNSYRALLADTFKDITFSVCHRCYKR